MVVSGMNRPEGGRPVAVFYTMETPTSTGLILALAIKPVQAPRMAALLGVEWVGLVIKLN
jgi:hypothetical protein